MVPDFGLYIRLSPRQFSRGLHLQNRSESLTNTEISGDMQHQRPEELSFHGSESTEGSDSTSRRGSTTVRGREEGRNASGRREVVAMACQPCRKRKTKCDGARPTCSACIQRGHTHCFYDSSSDMRRTSALKKRIDHLLDDITSLRNIVLTLTRGYQIPQDPMLVQLVEQTLCHGRWSYLPELSRVLEQHVLGLRQAVQTPQEPDGQGSLPTPMSASFQTQQSRPLPYVGNNYSPVESTAPQAYHAAVVPPSWSPIDIRTTPAVYTDVAPPNSSYMTYRPVQQYPVSSNAYS